MFKIQEKGKPETAIWLSDEVTVLSNDGEGQLALDIQPESGIIKVNIIQSNDKVYLSDTTFNVDITINNILIKKGSRVKVADQDNIQIGQQTFELVSPKNRINALSSVAQAKQTHWQLRGKGSWIDGQNFLLKAKTIIGRDASCDLTIPGSHLSRHHAELICTPKCILLKDLKSSNGTFVKGKKVQVAKLFPGDIVTFDNLSFVVIPPESEEENKSTVMMSAISMDDADQTVMGAAPSDNKSWATKSTSVGNQKTEADILLEKHMRNKRIVYSVLFVILMSFLSFFAVLFLA